jgi:hypothetical protein
LTVNIQLQGQIDVPALVDSGASDNFIDTTFIKDNGIKTQLKAIPELLTLVDGGLSHGGDIKEEVHMEAQVDGFTKEDFPSNSTGITSHHTRLSMVTTKQPGDRLEQWNDHYEGHLGTKDQHHRS